MCGTQPAQTFGFPNRLGVGSLRPSKTSELGEMMFSEKIRAIVRDSGSVEQALKRMRAEFGNGRLDHLFWGYSVHLHGVARNDALIADTFDSPDFVQAFVAAGGTSNDVVGNKIKTITQQFQIDIVQLAERQRDTGDARHVFTEAILEFGLKTAWICVLDEPWIGGVGVLNQFYSDRGAEPAIALEHMSEIAHIFHDEIRRHRLIAKMISLRPSQVILLSEVAMGKSASDLADKYEISSRAVEKRLENVRKALKSRNTLEAVYKATMYGVLPFRISRNDGKNL